ncbi:MAG: PEGA domain-containing protein [bacterium]|nr:PEGA domain-containing protein [bacterium]
MTKPESEADIQARRRSVLGLILSGIGIVLAILWGLWAMLHNQTGVLIVTSRPSGAEVILNFRPTNLVTSAFLSDLPADSFIVSLRLDGYRPIPPSQGISVQPNETTRVTFLLSPTVRGDSRPYPVVQGKPHDWQ